MGTDVGKQLDRLIKAVVLAAEVSQNEVPPPKVSKELESVKTVVGKMNSGENILCEKCGESMQIIANRWVSKRRASGLLVGQAVCTHCGHSVRHRRMI